MAFGDLIKSGRASAFASTITPDLGSNPASGNLLIATFGVSAARTIVTPPSGFTELHSVAGASISSAWYYKISDGTEQTASITWDSNSGISGLLVEYEWDGSTPDVTKNDDQTNIDTATNSQASGAATPLTTNNICIAAHGARQGATQFIAQAVDGSWIEDILFVDTARGDVKVSRLVNAAVASQEATHTDSDTGLSMYGAIAIFDVPSGATTTPKTLPYTVIGTASLDKNIELTHSLPYTAVGSASLGIVVTHFAVASMTATGSASLSKKISKSFSAAAAGTASLVKKMFHTSTSTATGTASLDESTIQTHTASATATGTSSLSTIFTAGTGFIRNFIRKIALSLGLGL